MIDQATNNPAEPLLLSLRGQGRFWHRTPLPSLEAILRHGAIVPNVGQFIGNSTQSESSYGRCMKAVSLFDFDTSSEKSVLDRALGNLFIRGLSSTVLIGVERKGLDPAKLQLPDKVSNGVWLLRLSGHSGHAAGLTHIPEIEALYFGEIPTSAFSGFYLAAQGGRFFEVPLGANAITILNEKSAEWQADDERVSAERRDGGDGSLAEMISESYNHRDNS
jgi:hypothetical protein